VANTVRRWQESWLFTVPIRPIEVDPNWPGRFWGSSPWRRTRDQGSDLVILPSSELFSCLLWTVGCSRGALEPLDETGPCMDWMDGTDADRHTGRRGCSAARAPASTRGDCCCDGVDDVDG
jgi:hypothetical protein